MGGIPLHHQALGAAEAKLRQQRIQIGRIVVAVGGDEQLAALLQIAAQFAHLIHQRPRRGKILRGNVDDEQIAVVRDVAGKQIQRRDGEVLVLQRRFQGIGQGLLAVVGGIVGAALFPAGQAVEGGGELALAVKGHAGRAVEVVVGVILGVEVGGVQHDALFPAGQDQTAVCGILRAVLSRKRRVEGGVLPLPADVCVLSGVVVQQLCNEDVLVACFGQIVDGHVRVDVLCHCL